MSGLGFNPFGAMSSLSGGGLWQKTSFAQTGIPNVMGNGLAYEKNSGIARFLDDLNDTVSTAMTGPDGQNVMDWANGLVLQQQLRKAGMGGGADMANLLGMGGAGLLGAGAGAASGNMAQLEALLKSLGSNSSEGSQEQLSQLASEGADADNLPAAAAQLTTILQMMIVPKMMEMFSMMQSFGRLLGGR